MDPKELQKIIDDHGRWLRDEPGGKRAYLSRANLTGAKLTGANLTEAYLTRANLTGACLTGAYLTGAYLSRANLSRANLTGACLTEANLTGANLTGANLSRANLTGANLTEANLKDTILEKRRIRFLTEAIELGQEIFALPWNCEAIAQEKNLYVVPGESKAVIAFSEDLSGGFCFVHHRREIWWWSFRCPNPKTVTVLWKMEDDQDAPS